MQVVNLSKRLKAHEKASCTGMGNQAYRTISHRHVPILMDIVT